MKDPSTKYDAFSEMSIIDIWFRTDKAMIMYLSDGTLQVGNFLNDGTLKCLALPLITERYENSERSVKKMGISLHR